MSRRKKPNKSQRVLAVVSGISRYDIKWKYFWVGLLGALVLGLIQKWVLFTEFLSSLDWALIKDYLAILFTWPTAILILGLLFIFRFSSSIRIFLEKLDRMKALGVELSQQQSTTETVQAEEAEQEAVEKLEKEASDGSITLTKEQVDELVNVIENMDFRFLNLHLVQNSKNALQLMTRIQWDESTFLHIYQVPSQIKDPVSERRAILSALTTAGLIVVGDDGMLTVTDKGIRFLKFIGLG